MSITCKFQLSRSSNIYYSGEEIVGSLTICAAKPRKLEAIILEFYGQSTIQWWELDKKKESIVHNDFSTHEILDKTLYGHQQEHVFKQLHLSSLSKNQLLLPHVEYTFKYHFTIPWQAPATYRCMFGQTEYSLRLEVQRWKKANKEFHQRIVVKNKLDLTRGVIYKKPCAVYHHNEFGKITLQIPCSGFTPAQQIPYYLKYHTTKSDCKVIIQFNCYTTCRGIQNSCNKFKQIKQIIYHKKHLSSESSSHINIPLHCYTSSVNDLELIISVAYLLEALLVQSNKKILLVASIPLTIGTSPCCIFDGDLENYMCFNNLGKYYDLRIGLFMKESFQA